MAYQNSFLETPVKGWLFFKSAAGISLTIIGLYKKITIYIFITFATILYILFSIKKGACFDRLKHPVKSGGIKNYFLR
jgi:hypothetical protein